MTDLVNPRNAVKLLELQAEQAARRRDFHGHHELDELRAMKLLAHKIFGPRGVLEANPDEPGVVYIGEYDRVYHPLVPTQRRRRRLVLRGYSHAELVEQARLLGFSV